MVDPMFAERAVQQTVQSFGPIGTKRIVARTQLKKSVVNAILHRNRHYDKIEQSPVSTKNKRPVWKWSDEKVPLPAKNRVVKKPDTDAQDEF